MGVRTWLVVSTRALPSLNSRFGEGLTSASSLPPLNHQAKLPWKLPSTQLTGEAEWVTPEMDGGTPFPQRSWVGCPCADEVPKEPTAVPKQKPRLNRVRLWRVQRTAANFVPKILGALGGSGYSGML